VELSDVCKTECSSLARQGWVFSTGLNEIPFPDCHFDLAGYRVQGTGFRVQGMGYGVWDLGF